MGHRRQAPAQKKEKILCVSADKNIDAALANIISSHAYHLEVISIEQWLNQHAHEDNGLQLFLLRNKQQLDSLSPHLETNRNSQLGIFLSSDTRWADESRHLFNDVVSWPCADQEFIQHIESLVKQERSGFDETRLLEEFSGLNLIGRSAPFIATLKLIKKISRYDTSTLIFGETGTGKEMAARAIHYLGGRRDAPFIPVNCGAIPDELVENELFGHEKGAFTDANSAQPGVVELARGGTLFLDEVDALSAKAQVALLRLIQEREYRPLGSKQFKQADIRIIAATNHDLHQAVSEQYFREDLMFRLNVLSLTMPTLRQRKPDIEILSEHMLDRFSDQYQQPVKRIHPDTLASMKRYVWPGNVRELENMLHRESLLGDHPVLNFRVGNPVAKERRLTPIDRRATTLLKHNFGAAKAEAIASFEQSYLIHLLETTAGNISEAARRAGKERRALGRLIKKYDIDTRRFKASSQS